MATGKNERFTSCRRNAPPAQTATRRWHIFASVDGLDLVGLPAVFDVAVLVLTTALVFMRSCVRSTMLWVIVFVVDVDVADHFVVFDVVDVVILLLYC
jgi:hypothetical protein